MVQFLFSHPSVWSFNLIELKFSWWLCSLENRASKEQNPELWFSKYLLNGLHQSPKATNARE